MIRAALALALALTLSAPAEAASVRAARAGLVPSFPRRVAVR